MGSVFSSPTFTPEKMAAIKSIVDSQIANNKNIVYSKTYCPYCTRAKNELNKLKIPYELVELDVEAEGAAIQQYLAEKTGQRTVPNIYINGTHIGGCDNLVSSIKSGKIKTILAQ